ncbi:MAG: 23S rRNA (guanosine(2251)-2'-O)-methyltransferase RlmB [Rhizobiales bacterium]|nr:23S rRNA (guanosine(2251)-2'-O)-methyltransferase RlmB [Hyphomicrobiales bacterium]
MTVLYGHHAVAAALDNPARRLRSLLVSEAGGMHIEASIRRRGIAPTVVAPGELDRMLGGESVHQGVVMTADPLDGPDVGELAARLARARQRTDPRDGERGGAPRPLVVLLDQVTDPHNVGAILRSAAVFGLIGLVMTRHNSPPLGGALAKAASGGLELVPVALVANLARALDTLADGGVTVLGLDAQGNGRIEDVATGSDPIALVLGAEDKGLRRLTRERCDAIVSISTAASMTSLNVSNAAAIAFHALSRR